MEKYMFIFIGGDGSHMSPEEQQAQMQRWFAWVDKLHKEGRYVSGEALLPDSKRISGIKKTVTDGPFVESKELVGGYFVIQAKNFDEAVSIASEYPDFNLGGTVEVRHVIKFER